MTISRTVGMVLAAALLGCNSGSDATAPDLAAAPELATVSHFRNHAAEAMAFTQINGEMWFVDVYFYGSRDFGPQTILFFSRRPLPLESLPLETFQVRIPDADFTIGGRNGEWALHTTVPRGRIDLVFHNDGFWSKNDVQHSPQVFDDQRFIQAGNAVHGGRPWNRNLSGTIFGEVVSPVDQDPDQHNQYAVLNLYDVNVIYQNKP